MKNKLQKTYENIFNKIKENIKIYSNNTSYKPQEFLFDLEISISNSISVIFPLIKNSKLFMTYRACIRRKQEKIYQR